MKRLLLGALLVLTACGGGSDDSARQSVDDPTTQDGTTSIPGTGAAATTQRLLAIADGDPIAPAVALLVAADRGYLVDTIFDAIADGRFSLDGIIVDASGIELEPTGTDMGLITNKEPLQGLRRPTPAPITTFGLADQLLLELQMLDLAAIPSSPPEAPRMLDSADPDSRNAYLVLRIAVLLRQGRSAADIIGAVVEGNLDLCFDGLDADVGLCDARNVPDLSQPPDAPIDESAVPANTEADEAPSSPADPPPVPATPVDYNGRLGFPIWLDTGEPDAIITDEALLTLTGDTVDLFVFRIDYTLIDSSDATCSGSGSYTIVTTATGAISTDIPVVLDYQGDAVGCLSPTGGTFSTTGTASVAGGDNPTVTVQLVGPGYDGFPLVFDMSAA